MVTTVDYWRIVPTINQALQHSLSESLKRGKLFFLFLSQINGLSDSMPHDDLFKMFENLSNYASNQQYMLSVTKKGSFENEQNKFYMYIVDGFFLSLSLQKYLMI